MPDLSILRSAQEHATEAGLDEAQKRKEVAVDATPDSVEGSVSATVTGGPRIFKGGTVTAYGRYAWDGVKGWAAGLRFRKTLK